MTLIIRVPSKADIKPSIWKPGTSQAVKYSISRFTIKGKSNPSSSHKQGAVINFRIGLINILSRPKTIPATTNTRQLLL